jgi:hypothetical protein
VARSHNREVSGSDGEWVSVDLLDESPPQAPAAGSAVATPRPRGRRALVGGVAAAVLGALLLWPQGGTSTDTPAPLDGAAVAEQPAPDDPRLLPWPARGPWAADEQFIEQATAVWRASAEDPGSMPGVEVHALWAGPVGDVDVAVLQSVGQDGQSRVAQVTESRIPGSISPGALTLTGTEVVRQAPPFVVLSYGGGLDVSDVLREPGTSFLQVLPAPDLVSDGVELQRQSGVTFETVDVQGDGLSEPWVHTPGSAPEGPVLAAVRTRGPYPGLLSTSLIDPQALLPGPAPVLLVPSAWGELRGALPQDYVDAQTALAAVGRTSGRVSILGSTPTVDGHASLVEVRPRGPGRPIVVTVASRGGSTVVSRPRPSATPADIVVGAARSPDGALLVVAAAPPDTTLLLIGRDGEVVARGPRTTAVWLPRDVDVSAVAAQGYRNDETWVGRTVLDVTDL